jgi:putative ABC transport system substrate-binding protein
VGHLGVDMRRRNFLAFVGGVSLTWPLAARAQPSGKLPTIGFLGPNPTAWRPRTDAFVERLRQLGWIEDRTIAIEYRWDDGNAERDAEIAAEFVHREVDVIVTYGAAAAISKRVTATIPIVFAIAVDPIGSGLVANLSHPGGNVTGLSIQSTDIAGKRLELLREAVPGLHRVAVIADVGYAAAVREMGEVQAAARTLGLQVTPLEIRSAEDIAPAFDALKAKADALYVVGDALINAHQAGIITPALGARLPTIFNDGEFVQAGALMSYGPNEPALFRRAAELVDKILHGTKPNEIPVEQPTKFELVINTTTAKAIGISIPPTLLARADEMIE